MVFYLLTTHIFYIIYIYMRKTEKSYVRKHLMKKHSKGRGLSRKGRGLSRKSRVVTRAVRRRKKLRGEAGGHSFKQGDHVVFKDEELARREGVVGKVAHIIRDGVHPADTNKPIFVRLNSDNDRVFVIWPQNLLKATDEEIAADENQGLINRTHLEEVRARPELRELLRLALEQRHAGP